MTNRKGESSYRPFLKEESTIENLVLAYGDLLVRFAYCYVKDSAVAEDIMEDAFALLLIKRKVFNSGENLKAYLYKIVRNKCIDYLRFRKRFRPLEDYENVLVGFDVSDHARMNERKQTLYLYMNKLPKQYAEVLYFVYIDDCTIEQVCSLLKKNKKQVYNLLTRAKLSLKNLFNKDGLNYEDLS